MLDIETQWTPSRLLSTSSALSASSRTLTPDRLARATSWLRIEDTTKCSRIARGFAFGSSTEFAADMKLTPGYGFRASAAFPVLERLPECQYPIADRLSETTSPTTKAPRSEADNDCRNFQRPPRKSHCPRFCVSIRLRWPMAPGTTDCSKAYRWALPPRLRRWTPAGTSVVIE